MNATQPSRPPLQKSETRRTAPKIKSRRRPHPYRAIAVETTAKLAVNVVFLAAAVSGLVRLLPLQWSQQEKLQEIQTEVKLTEGRVNLLRTDFDRYFDPQQAKNIMSEQSNRVAPGQRPVILLNRSAKNAP